MKFPQSITIYPHTPLPYTLPMPLCFGRHFFITITITTIFFRGLPLLVRFRGTTYVTNTTDNVPVDIISLLYPFTSTSTLFCHQRCLWERRFYVPTNFLDWSRTLYPSSQKDTWTKLLQLLEVKDRERGG